MFPAIVLTLLFVNPPVPVGSPESVAVLAETGHCKEALPAVKRMLTRLTEPKMKRRLGVAGLRCAMRLNQQDQAADFLRVLTREFPKDPELLYMLVHAYSDLSLRASQQLLFTAPSSPQVHELNAEALEAQGKWEEASSEYKRVLEQNPSEPGMHYRLGRLILSRPKRENTVEDARKEMEAELKIDPNNAGAEFVLGELARQAEEWPGAIEHFRRATELDASFADAWLGLGRACVLNQDFAEAIAPLQTAVKLQPENPTLHYELAVAYAHAGRKDDAKREAELQKVTTERARKAKDEVQKGVQGIQ